MVCYGPRLSTIAVACAVGYVLLHRVIGQILHIAGLVLEVALIACVAVAAAVLVAWTVRTVQRRRAAAGACTTCRFRCQQPLTRQDDQPVASRPAAPRAPAPRQPVMLPVTIPLRAPAAEPGRPELGRPEPGRPGTSRPGTRPLVLR
jgi:hypothetical protein